MTTWVFHRGALGDSVLVWPRLRAWVKSGERVVLVTDGAKARLAAREVGVEGVDAESARFHVLWREGAEVEPARVDGVSRVVEFVSGGAGVFAENLKRMFPGARVESARPPRGGREAREFEAVHPGSRVELRANETGPVVVHVGAGSEAKRWGMEGWREVVGELRAKGARVEVIAGEVERERLGARERGMFEGMGGRFVESVMELADVARGARVFVGCDSGPTHLAAQLGVRTVALFGPTDPEEWGPVGPGVRVVAPESRRAMGWLDVGRVANEVEGVLRR